MSTNDDRDPFAGLPIMGPDDPLQAERRARAAKAEELKSAYRALFAGQLAELVLADIAEQGGVFLHNIGADEFEHGKNEGQRRLALRILKLSGREVPTPWAPRAHSATPPANGRPREAITENSEPEQ